MTRQYRYNISILYGEKILTRLIGIRDYRTVNDTLTYSHSFQIGRFINVEWHLSVGTCIDFYKLCKVESINCRLNIFFFFLHFDATIRYAVDEFV